MPPAPLPDEIHLILACDRPRMIGHPASMKRCRSYHNHEEMLVFKASSNDLGQTYNVGTFAAGTRIVFALKTPDGQAYYTDSSLNRDGCDHARKLQLGTDRWELRCEDMYGLGSRMPRKD